MREGAQKKNCRDQREYKAQQKKKIISLFQQLIFFILFCASSKMRTYFAFNSTKNSQYQTLLNFVLNKVKRILPKEITRYFSSAQRMVKKNLSNYQFMINLHLARSYAWYFQYTG